MKKIIFAFMILLTFTSVAFAEDIYCGEFNGKPAYVDLESIQKHSRRTGVWEVTNSGIWPERSYSYSANIYADGLWYEVHFVESTKSSSSAWILDKNKKSTHTPVDTIDFDFAFRTVQQHYPEANRRNEARYKKINEERDRKNIEEAKKKYDTSEAKIDTNDPKQKTGYAPIPYKDQTKTQLSASLTNAITKYVQAYNAAPEQKNITPEMRSAGLEVKAICEFFTKDELIVFANGDIEMQKALLSFK